MKQKRTDDFLIALGIFLLLGAILFYGGQAAEDAGAHKAAEQALPILKAQIEQIRTAPTEVPHEEAGTEPTELRPMAEAEIDGERYIGYLSIEALHLNLPVLSDWDDSKLKKAPCRQFGTAEGRDLVIAAHNYRSHFGALGALEPGDSISFEDVTGTSYRYTVQAVEVIAPDAVAYVKESPWDLVLYTCAASGRKRILVGANAAE